VAIASSLDYWITWGDGLTSAPTSLTDGYFLAQLPIGATAVTKVAVSVTFSFIPTSAGHISWGVNATGGALTGAAGATIEVGAGNGPSAIPGGGPQYFQLTRIA
jgi:hypothetical protein